MSPLIPLKKYQIRDMIRRKTLLWMPMVLSLEAIYPYFLPPYEWYNATISQWAKQLDLHLVNFSPGTRSNADYTYPQMGDRYVSSEVVYQSILDYEAKDPHGLNGFILLIHIGTDLRRTDKLYDKLDALLTELERKGYRFLKITELLE